MNRLVLTLFAVSIVAGCGATPGYVPPEGPGAYLQNRLVEIEEARFFHFFEYVNGNELEPGGINKASSTSRVIMKTNSPYDARYKITPGRTIVGVRLVYTPAFGSNIIARMNDVYYHVFVRDMHISEDQLAYLAANIPEAAPGDFSGMRGLTFDAVEGQTYVANSRIRDGKATVWIEDAAGAVVSTAVTAFGEGNVDIHGTFGELVVAHPFVDGVPDPKYGWGINANLPDPPHIKKQRQFAAPAVSIGQGYSARYDALIRLGELRDEGKITQEEFEREKKRLLSDD